MRQPSTLHVRAHTSVHDIRSYADLKHSASMEPTAPSRNHKCDQLQFPTIVSLMNPRDQPRSVTPVPTSVPRVTPTLPKPRPQAAHPQPCGCPPAGMLVIGRINPSPKRCATLALLEYATQSPCQLPVISKQSPSCLYGKLVRCATSAGSLSPCARTTKRHPFQLLYGPQRQQPCNHNNQSAKQPVYIHGVIMASRVVVAHVQKNLTCTCVWPTVRIRSGTTTKYRIRKSDAPADRS